MKFPRALYKGRLAMKTDMNTNLKSNIFTGVEEFAGESVCTYTAWERDGRFLPL